MRSLSRVNVEQIINYIKLFDIDVRETTSYPNNIHSLSAALLFDLTTLQRDKIE